MNSYANVFPEFGVHLLNDTMRSKLSSNRNPEEKKIPRKQLTNII